MPVIHFSHSWASEFLTSSRFAETYDTISCRHHVSMIPAHAFVAQACLGMLLHLDEGIAGDSLKKFLLAKHPAVHWVDHACFEGVGNSSRRDESAVRTNEITKHILRFGYVTRIPCQYSETPSPSRTLRCFAVMKFLVNEHLRHVHSRDVDKGLA
jgi:hypothetical protein